MKELNYPDINNSIPSVKQTKASLEHLYDCMKSAVYDDYNRKCYVSEKFNEEWENLFGEEGKFKLEGE